MEQYITDSDYYKFLGAGIKMCRKMGYKATYIVINDRDYKKLLELDGFAEFCNKIDKKPIIQIIYSSSAAPIHLFLNKGNPFPEASIEVFESKYTNLLFFMCSKDIEFKEMDKRYWGKNKK
jgi:hypothetical protein